jgi:cyclophilin family peptidyl-prolyl cis-trans isomerase
MKNKNFLLFTALLTGFVLLIGFSQPGNSTNNKQNEKMQTVLISTDLGDMTVVLYNETPEHRDNFLRLAQEGFYNDLLFHRVIDGFMIQAGDPNSRGAATGERLGSGGPGYTVVAEIQDGLFHQKGALSAARQGDQVNPEKRSSGSQFYIVQGRRWTEQELEMMANNRGSAFSEEQIEKYTNVGGTPHLDNEYTVFGQVIAGLEVIDKIAAVQTGPGDRPVEDVKIKSITLIE